LKLRLLISKETKLPTGLTICERVKRDWPHGTVKRLKANGLVKPSADSSSGWSSAARTADAAENGTNASENPWSLR
jgi:hypothetical protein